MNILDGIILVCLVGGIFLGYIRGFINQLVSIIGLIISYVAAILFYEDLSPWIAKIIPLSSWKTVEPYEPMIHILKWDTYFYNVIAFVLIFFSAKLILTIAGHFLNFIAKVPGLNALNKWSGAFLGLLEVIILLIIVINVMSILPSEQVHALLAGSEVVQFINEQWPSIAEKLHELWNTSNVNNLTE